MVAPFTEAAFSLPVGEVSQPVRTRFGYHLIEVLSQDKDKDTGEVYQVHARHILLKVTPGPDHPGGPARLGRDVPDRRRRRHLRRPRPRPIP